VMARLAPEVRIIDITHHIAPADVTRGAAVLAQAVPHLPPAVHVAVVDPGVGTPRALLVAIAGEQAVLAPDNGLLAPLLARGTVDRVIQIDNARLVRFGVSDVSATFHGRDVFAPLAAAIAAGRCDPADLGSEVTSINQVGFPSTLPRADGGIAGVIVVVDRFGNLISNIESSSVVSLTMPTVLIAGLRLPLKRTYGDAKAGEYLGLINSFDVLEVAQSRGNAAAGLNLAVGAGISAVPASPDPQFRRS
jgi:S-adenosylmethionine hydrolase